MSDKASIATVGMFDGLHRGHQFVLQQLRNVAREHGLSPRVITFDRHPATILQPDRVPPLLMSPEEKIAAIRSFGHIDDVRVLPFTKELAAATAAQFLRRQHMQGVEAFAMGFNNHIGSDRLDSVRADALGIMPVVSLPPCPDSEDVSSSALRLAIAQGRVGEAAIMLGRPYELRGTVVHGHQLGRTIGFPTANISVGDTDSRLLPADGVYVADIQLEGDTLWHRAMLNIGRRPTVDVPDAPQTIEAHILNFDADIYGRIARLKILTRLRPERQFDSLQHLRRQLEIDAIAAQNFAESK